MLAHQKILKSISPPHHHQHFHQNGESHRQLTTTAPSGPENGTTLAIRVKMQNFVRFTFANTADLFLKIRTFPKNLPKKSAVQFLGLKNNKITQGENEAIANSKPISFAKLVLGLKPGAGKVTSVGDCCDDNEGQVGPGAGDDAGEEGGVGEASLEEQTSGRFASLVRRSPFSNNHDYDRQ